MISIIGYFGKLILKVPENRKKANSTICVIFFLVAIFVITFTTAALAVLGESPAIDESSGEEPVRSLVFAPRIERLDTEAAVEEFLLVTR